MHVRMRSALIALVAAASAVGSLVGCNQTANISPPLLGTSPPPLPVRSASLVVGEIASGHREIEMFSLGVATSTPSNVITSSFMCEPNRLARDSRGNLFVGDTCNNQILIFDETATGSSTPAAVVSGTCSGNEQIGVVVTADGSSVWGACFANGARIQLFGPLGVTGTIGASAVISGNATTLLNPNALALDAAGNVWVTDTGDCTVKKFAAGSSGNVAPSLTLSTFSGCVFGGITFDPSGNLFVTTQTPDQVLMWNAGVSSNIAPNKTWTSASFNGPDGVIADSTFVYEGNFGGTTVCWFPTSHASGAVTVTGCVTGLASGGPAGLTF